MNIFLFLFFKWYTLITFMYYYVLLMDIIKRRLADFYDDILILKKSRYL